MINRHNYYIIDGKRLLQGGRVHIAVFDDLPEGGAKRVAFEHVKRLSAEHTVYYISNTIPTQFPFERYAHDVFRFPMELWPVKGVGRPLQELSYVVTYDRVYRKIARLLNALNIDVVLIHPSKLTQCPGLSLYTMIPTVYFAHEWLRLVYEPLLHPLPHGLEGIYEQQRRHFIASIDKQAVSQAKRLVTTSNYNASRITWAYGRKAIPLSLGVDTEQFVYYQNSKRKNLLFIGEKSDINGYDILPKKCKIPITYVQFKGHGFRYSDTALTKLYSQAIATLCLARNEPFGLIPLESMACETPVIAIAEGGYAETVVNGKTGWLISPLRQNIETVISQITAHPELIERYGTAGRKRVTTQYRWDEHILRLEKILNEACHD